MPLKVITKPVPRKRKKLVDIQSYGNKFKDYKKFKKDLLNAVGDDIWSTTNQDEVRYIFLKRIKQVAQQTSRNEKSIEKSIIKVLTQKGLEDLPPPRPHGDPIRTLFDYHILGFYTPPAYNLSYLEANVTTHLQKINNLIAKYEKDDYIKNYIAENTQPKNPEQRMQLDFYKRSIKERQRILNYFLHGMRERALKKSFFEIDDLAMPFHYLYDPDFPYRFYQRYYTPYFDSDKLHGARHRLDNVYLDEVDDYIKFYLKNKKLFYKKYFKEIEPKEILKEEILLLVHSLPIIRDRKDIFKELMQLFSNRRWAGFYGLGLAQIEGLFTDMSEIVSKNNLKSLTEKVLEVKRHVNYDKLSFDYFAYKIPDLRNKFMHTGHDTDLEIKSYDLITDLVHILRLYNGLNNPYTKLHDLIKKPIDQFKTYEDIAKYLKLLNEYNQKDIPKLRRFASDFNAFSKSLKDNCDFVSMTRDSQGALDITISNIKKEFELYFNESVRAEIFKLKLNDIEAYILNDSKMIFSLRRLIIHNEHDFERLIAIKIFKEGLNEILFFDIKSEFSDFNNAWNNQMKFIVRFLTMNDVFSKTENENDDTYD